MKEIFAKRLLESTTSCMMMMTQGNILAITLGHWGKALQVGLIASLATVFLIKIHKEDLTQSKYVMAGIIGIFTAVADLATHPTHFGGVTTEAVVTGIGAGLLCLCLSNIKGYK
jgi:hypothetical protein